MSSVSGLAENLRAFSSEGHFRSASVDELVLEDDFFRRPLRPEDLKFVDFVYPVTEDRFDALSSLMSQRILLSINEAEEGTLAPRGPEKERWESFHGGEVRRRGRLLLGELEAHALGFLASSEPASLGHQLADNHLHAERFWRDQKERLHRSEYEEAGLRYILVQNVPLGESVHASACRLPPPIANSFGGRPFSGTTAALKRRMEGLGLRTGRHSYWQFYLPGSMAAANLLYQLGRSPSTLCDYVGARLVLETDRAGLRDAFCHVENGPAAEARDEFCAVAQSLLALLGGGPGSQEAIRVGAGAARMSHLLAAARAGLSAQMAWLSDIRWAERAAWQISERIKREAPDIDRDTFVEPREMCSTTHVHDEHRLVVIEAGRMRFWGNIGMRHDMGPGDMILVPKGRLHGSTVLSASCTYHQPIIPDDWKEAIPAWAAAS